MHPHHDMYTHRRRNANVVIGSLLLLFQLTAKSLIV